MYLTLWELVVVSVVIYEVLVNMKNSMLTVVFCGGFVMFDGCDVGSGRLR